MSIDPDTIEVGERLYSKSRYRMGNTTMSHTAIYVSIVKEVFRREDGSVESAMIIWNGNRPEKQWASQIKITYSRFHPKPHQRPFSGSDYDEEVRHAAEIAAEERAAYRARVKAKKLEAKGATE